MKEVILQLDNKTLRPFSEIDAEALKAFRQYQPIRAKLYGVEKPRSYKQNKWIHSIFKIVAANSNNPDWDTDIKVKRNVKMAMKFFKDEVIVDRNKVYFELRSFAFDKMEQAEADIKYNEAKMICAKHLGVDPETLEAEARKE